MIMVDNNIVLMDDFLFDDTNGYDQDAFRYLTEIGYTDTAIYGTIINAVNNYFLNLKGAYNGVNYWSKRIAIYPFLGTTFLQHSINAGNVSTYTLVKQGAGTLTHSNAGLITSASACMNTNSIYGSYKMLGRNDGDSTITTVLTLKTNATTGIDVGGGQTGASTEYSLVTRNASNQAIAKLVDGNSSSAVNITIAGITDSRGVHVFSKYALAFTGTSNVHTMQSSYVKNGVILSNAIINIGAGTSTNLPVLIGGNNGRFGVSYAGIKHYGTVAFFQPMNDVDSLALDFIHITFETDLGR